MKKERTEFHNRVVDNIRKIMKVRDLKQAAIAMDADMPYTAMSKIMSGSQGLTLDYLSKIAKVLSLREIDLITYPITYEPIGNDDDGPAEVLLQLRLTKDKKDQVLKLVFGDNDIEILNK